MNVPILRPRVPQAETFLRKKGVNVYRCPVCCNEFRHDDEFEPCCTGPTWRHEHEITVMELVKVDEPLIIVP